VPYRNKGWDYRGSCSGLRSLALVKRLFIQFFKVVAALNGA
jgi:hypothetical protein